MGTTARRGQAQVYAEDKLGINEIFVEVQEIEALLKSRTERRRQIDSALRDVRDDLDQTTLAARQEFREANEELSATAFDSKVRDYIGGLDSVQAFRKQMKNLQGELDVVANDISLLERQHRSHVARMQSLAGYLNFLAATKNGANVARLVADIV